MRVTADDVSYAYPGTDRRLFTGLAASWGAGTLSALCGPSGSGKSTLLDLLGGLRRPDEGAVTIFDDDRPLPPAHHRQACAWVVQSNILFSHRTVIDNVLIGALVAGRTLADAREAATASLARIGLHGKERQLVDSLSGGEQQRLTIARCLLSSADVILADEPTGNLDAHNTSLVVDCLRVAAQAGKTVIVATHDHAVVSACDAVVDLAEGR